MLQLEARLEVDGLEDEPTQTSTLEFRFRSRDLALVASPPFYNRYRFDEIPHDGHIAAEFELSAPAFSHPLIVDAILKVRDIGKSFDLTSESKLSPGYKSLAAILLLFYSLAMEKRGQVASDSDLIDFLCSHCEGSIETPLQELRPGYTNLFLTMKASLQASQSERLPSILVFFNPQQEFPFTRKRKREDIPWYLLHSSTPIYLF